MAFVFFALVVLTAIWAVVSELSERSNRKFHEQNVKNLENRYVELNRMMREYADNNPDRGKQRIVSTRTRKTV